LLIAFAALRSAKKREYDCFFWGCQALCFLPRLLLSLPTVLPAAGGALLRHTDRSAFRSAKTAIIGTSETTLQVGAKRQGGQP
jgi:hypothetical protein